MDSINLLVDSHCFDYKTSEGVNTYIKGLYCELTKIAPEINFYFLAKDLENLNSIFGESNNIHYIALRSENKIIRLLIELPRIIRKFNIDIAHYQYVAPVIKNCHTIVTLHDILFKDFPALFPYGYRLSKNILFGLSAKRADLLLTVSEYSRNRIAYHYNINKDKIIVTPNAVSEDFFHIDKNEAISFVRSQGISKYILCVSRVEPRKNQIAILKAYHELDLANYGYDLVFIGRQSIPVPNFDSYLSALTDVEKRHIHIYHQVGYHELKLWYKAADLFVYPALAEGFGIPPIEAGAAGVPCICSNKTAMGDFSFFGKNLIDVNDESALAKTIHFNIVNPPDTVKIQSIIHEQYNWSDIAEKFYSNIKSYYSIHND